MKILSIQIERCGQCPYCREGTHKGLPDGEYSCHKVYDDRPNYQGSYRRVGNRYDYNGQIPEWCPLPSQTEES